MFSFKKLTSLVLSLMLVFVFSQIPVFATGAAENTEEITTQQEVTEGETGDSVTAEDEIVVEEEVDSEELEEIVQEPVENSRSVKSTNLLTSGASDLFAGGSGTIDDPYQIETVEQLDYVRNDLNAHYVLINDISFNTSDFSQDGQFYNEGKGWSPIGNESNPFSGSFDGQQYAINGLVITSDNQYNGLFGYTSGATVQNMTVDSNYDVATKTTSAYVGGVIGYANNSNITNCAFEGQLSSKLLSTSTAQVPHYVGGIVGYHNSGTIENCYSNGKVCPNATCGSFGGIVGLSTGSINNCINDSGVFSNCTNEVNGNVDSMTFYGGIAGTSSDITLSQNNGTIDARGAVGGIVGKTSGTCTDCTNEGDITATTQTQNYGGAKVYVGGIIATGGYTIDCTNRGSITGKCYNREVYAGGILGKGNATNSVNYGDVSADFLEGYGQNAEAFSGGIGASISATNCHNYGKVFSNSSYMGDSAAGGITGKSSGSISCSSNHASIEIQRGTYQYGDYYAGGIAGTGASVTKSYNVGHVTCRQYAGGIVGRSTKTVTDCYNLGKIRGSYSGGISGSNASTISNVYNVGIATSAITNHNSGTVQNAYYLNNVSNGVGNDEYLGEVLTEEQMKTSGSYGGFDFETVWNLDTNMRYCFPIITTAGDVNSQYNLSIVDAGHTWNSEYTTDKAATCSNEGVESIHCLECGDIKEDSVRSIEKKPHTYGDWNITRQPTCSDVGMKNRTCSVCSYVEEAEIPIESEAHSWGEWTSISDTQHKRICEHNNEHEETADHNWDSGKVKDPATCVSEGSMIYTCEDCKAIKEEAIAIDENAHSSVVAVTKATLSDDGATVETCKLCNSELSRIIISKPSTFKLSSSSYTYTGSAKKPTITVMDADGKTIAATNYSAAYSNNVNAGKTATVTVTFKGTQYSGTKSLNFTINKAANPLTIKAKTGTVKYSKLKKKAQSLAVTKVIAFSKKGQGKMTYKKVSGNKKITINETTGKVTIKKGLKKGKYKVKIKVMAGGTANYKASAWKTVTTTITVK